MTCWTLLLWKGQLNLVAVNKQACSTLFQWTYKSLEVYNTDHTFQLNFVRVNKRACWTLNLVLVNKKACWTLLLWTNRPTELRHYEKIGLLNFVTMNKQTYGTLLHRINGPAEPCYFEQTNLLNLVNTQACWTSFLWTKMLRKFSIVDCDWPTESRYCKQCSLSFSFTLRQEVNSLLRHHVIVTCKNIDHHSWQKIFQIL